MKRFIMNVFIIGMVFGGIWAVLGSRLVVAAAPDQSSVSMYVSYSRKQQSVGEANAADAAADAAAAAGIDVIDIATHEIVRTIKGIPEPHGMAFSPDGRWFYAASQSEKKSEQVLGIVDLITGKVVKFVPLSGVSEGTIALTKDGKRLFLPITYPSDKPGAASVYINGGLGGALDVVDTASREKVKTIEMKGGMHDVYLTPDGKYIVAGSAHGADGTYFMAVVDAQTEQEVWRLKFDESVYTMAFERGPDGSTKHIYVMNRGSHSIQVVDFAKRQVVAKFALPENEQFHAKDQLQPRSPAHGIQISPDNKTLWANSQWGNAVYKYSLPDLKLMGSANVGSNPNWMAITPDSKTIIIMPGREPSLEFVDTKSLNVTRWQLKFVPLRVFLGPALARSAR